MQNSKSNNQINNPKKVLQKNRCSNTVNIFPSVSKNHKRSHFFSPTYGNDMQTINYIDKDLNNGIGYKIVSLDMLDSSSSIPHKAPNKVNQYYYLFGKKVRKKPIIKTETISPLDEIYRKQYNKKLKMENKPTINMLYDMPKKLSPVFGRTGYAFYNRRDLDELGGTLTNSVDVKTNNNLNVINSNSSNNFNNNIGNSNNVPFNIKSFIKNNNKK